MRRTTSLFLLVLVVADVCALGLARAQFAADGVGTTASYVDDEARRP